MRDIDQDFFREPIATFWEQFCTLGNAERVHADVETAIRQLNKGAGGDEDDVFIAGFAWCHESLVSEEENPEQGAGTLR